MIPELKGFVAGIQRDYEAVIAAVEQHWSNGKLRGKRTGSSSLSGRCTAAADSCFYAGACFPSNPAALSTLPDFTKSAEDPFS